MKKYIATGCLGFINSDLVNQLSKRNKVIIIDDLKDTIKNY
jgi:nucleoside-diphosphate-sugar epimerase|tara:strand:- start:47 stop:169 length:123 start_codon:yes stop_codon:yes gene_type:complete